MSDTADLLYRTAHAVKIIANMPQAEPLTVGHLPLYGLADSLDAVADLIRDAHAVPGPNPFVVDAEREADRIKIEEQSATIERLYDGIDAALSALDQNNGWPHLDDVRRILRDLRPDDPREPKAEVARCRHCGQPIHTVHFEPVSRHAWVHLKGNTMQCEGINGVIAAPVDGWIHPGLRGPYEVTP